MFEFRHHKQTQTEIILVKINVMKKNMGSADKIIRISIAVIIGLLFALNVISGILAVVLLVLSGIFIVTSFVSFCPLYTPFNISTRKEDSK